MPITISLAAFDLVCDAYRAQILELQNQIKILESVCQKHDIALLPMSMTNDNDL